MTGRAAAFTAAVAPLVVVVLLLATIHPTGLGNNAHQVPGSNALNNNAVPTWARDLLHSAATACPEITAPLLAAQIHTESNWNPHAYNPTSGATGLSQFMPANWTQFGIDGDHDGTADPHNPADAIPSQAHYMCHLIDIVTATPNLTGDTIDLALAAYNAGPGNVKKHRGIPPFPETTHYVTTIRQLATTTYALTNSAPGVDQVIAAATAHIDITTYAWGGGTLTGPSRGMPPDSHVIGFDCSSLVRYAYYQGTNHTITLPRTSQQQYNATKRNPIPIADLQPGDLLFWGTPTTIHHVALYIGNGHMIEAPRSGQKVNKVKIRTDGDYAGATRVSANDG